MIDMNEEKGKLLIEIERLSEELQGYITDLKDEVSDAVEEAEDENTTLERLQEIRQAITRVRNTQEMGLNI